MPEQHRGGLTDARSRWAVTGSGVLAEALGGDFPQRLAAAKDPADPALWRPYWAAYVDTLESQWARPIAEWCAAHGLALTGRLLGEGSLGSQVAYYGRPVNSSTVHGMLSVGSLARNRARLPTVVM